MRSHQEALLTHGGGTRENLTTRFVLVLVATALVALANAAGAEPLESPAPLASGPVAPGSQSPEPGAVPSPSVSPDETPPQAPSPVAPAAVPAPPSPIASSPSSTPAPVPTVALPPAGVIPATLSLDVTGSPAADGAFLDVQIRAALDRAIRPTLRFGASVDYGPVAPWPLPALIAGSRAAVNVTVNIAGTDDSAPVTGVTLVTLGNVLVAPMEPTVLFLSDDPEYLRSEGLIFRGEVDVDRPVRLYYYQSNLGLPRDIDVVLTATAASRVQLIASDSGPDRDVMSVGHNVTRDFLQYRRANEGSVVDVVPGMPFIVRHGLLLQNEVVAGAVDVHVIGGGPVTVSVVASHAGTRPDAYLSGPRVGFDGHRRHGMFDLTGYGTIEKSYTVGGPPVTAQYGGRIPTPRNIDPSDDGRDFGDYGIIRRLTFTLDNPTDDPHHVYLYEKPLAGSVRSSFFVDGQLKELDCVRAAQPYSVMTYELAPHSTGATTTVTMTDGGSFYPLEFGVTDVQPAPYTPAYGAPDSCSPSLTATPQATSAPAISASH
jgi:hypothetical protein